MLEMDCTNTAKKSCENLEESLHKGISKSFKGVSNEILVLTHWASGHHPQFTQGMMHEPSPISTALNGVFHFELTSTAASGTKCLVHVKPTRQTSWKMNALDTCYVWLVMNHYSTAHWCYHTIIFATRAEYIANNVKFNCLCVTIPTITPADRIVEATRNLQQSSNNCRSRMIW